MAIYRLKRKCFGLFDCFGNFLRGTTRNLSTLSVAGKGTTNTFTLVKNKKTLKGITPSAGGEFTGNIYKDASGRYAIEDGGTLSYLNQAKNGKGYSVGKEIKGNYSYGENKLTSGQRAMEGLKAAGLTAGIGTAGFLGYQGINAMAGTTGNNSY